MQGHLGLESAQWLLEVDFLIEVDLANNILAILLELDQNLLEVFDLAHEVLLIASILVPTFLSLDLLQFPTHIVQFIGNLCVALDILLHVPP